MKPTPSRLPGEESCDQTRPGKIRGAAASSALFWRKRRRVEWISDIGEEKKEQVIEQKLRWMASDRLGATVEWVVVGADGEERRPCHDIWSRRAPASGV